MIDVARARRETPGCQYVTHLNNAGSSLPPQPVLDAVVGHLELEARVGGYEAHEQNEPAIERFYGAAAKLLGAHPEEIAFASSATRAWDMAFYGFPFERGDRILTAVAEYISNYIAYIQVAERAGVEVVPVPNDEYGQVSVDSLRQLVDERVKLIAITHVPTNGGLVNPAAEIGAVAREAGIPYLLDACQSVGQLPVDVEEIGCDVLSATGRKYLRGPRGTGFLYVRSSLLGRLEPPFLDMRAADWVEPDRYELRPDAIRFEEWEQAYAAKVGLSTAIDYALGWGLESIWQRVAALGESLRARLGDIEGVTVRDLGAVRCGIVTFTVDGVGASELKERLAREAINVTASPRSSTLLDSRARALPDLVRASVHYYNTDEELDRLVESVRIAALC
ncbi:MAG: aminotransferase class V-fold PLP-dependent enzyme [Actinobacteria bacterium]|nr:MAG: aminotransferase class V-fold PLP-dependent enzyme [Actinomycetota bacterium]TMM23445.1 MAG: aminotransferase class V-fold PLP-dependent enzyme [Actinomycetota bacterium]